jgi:hypothetical protein
MLHVTLSAAFIIFRKFERNIPPNSPKNATKILILIPIIFLCCESYALVYILYLKHLFGGERREGVKIHRKQFS